MPGNSKIALYRHSAQVLLAVCLVLGQAAWAQQQNTGIINDSIAGQGNMTSDHTGVAVNGTLGSNASVNSNQNQTSVHSTTSVNPVLYAPSQSTTSTSGGSSALVIPRNPLPMPNAMLGRSNFGLQFGVQNNPGLGLLNGQGNNLGWFAQAGLTIPFGKVPKLLENSANDMLVQGGSRRISMTKNSSDVLKAKVIKSGNGLSMTKTKRMEPVAYTPRNAYDRKIKTTPSRLIAVTEAEVYNKPFHAGERTGSVEVGEEYIYLGHTPSGWIKILMPDGTTGWTDSRFEIMRHNLAEMNRLFGEELAHRTAEKRELSRL